MMRYRVSTTALVLVHVVVDARDPEHALEVAAAMPRFAWKVGDLFGDVDLDGELDVAEHEDR